MNPVFNTVSRVSVANRQKNCFLCDAIIQNGHVRNVDQLFYEDSKNDQQESKTLATILTDILEQSVEEPTVHSKIVCRKCQQMCSEYDQLSARLRELKQNITSSFNETANKYNLKMIEMNLEQQYEGINDNDDGNISNMYAIESVDPAIGEIFNNENMDSNDFTKSAQMKKVMVIVADPLDEGKEYFEANGDQMIEISTNGSEGSESGYQYMFQEDSAEEIEDDENSSEMPDEKDGIIYDNDVYVKNEQMDGVIFQVKTSTRSNNKKINNTSENKELFIRDGKKFQCLLCSPDSLVIYDTKTISIHLKSDHNERIYVCSVCGLDFRKRNPYNDHMDEHMAALSDGTYECDLCQTSFSDARKFRAHKKNHNATVKIWVCKTCGKKYSSKNLLDEHMNMHTGARPYKCPHCTKDFASKYTLTAHMKIHYDRKRPYECKDCGKSFFSNQNLTQHVRTHTGVKEFECEVCNKKFGSQHNLEVHKIVHTGHKPFICRTCGKAFARRAEIKDHERTHTGER